MAKHQSKTKQQWAELDLFREQVINLQACPKCLASLGNPCVGKRNQERLSPHAVRFGIIRSPK